MKHKRWAHTVAALGLMLTLCGCSSYSRTASGFAAGETVTPEQLAEIAGEIFSAEASEGLPQATVGSAVTGAPPSTAEVGTVYWTVGGSVCHADRSCRYIREATEITEGTPEEAAEAGKGRPCSACG